MLAVPLGGVAFGVTTNAATLMETAVAPPNADAPDESWRPWIVAQIRRAVGAQDAALLAGDETGFVAIAHPGNSKLRNDLSRRYANLHALGPGVWHTAMIPNLTRNEPLRWSASLGVAYCFGPPTCQPAAVVNQSEWVVEDGRLVLDALGTDISVGPRPWETTDLVVEKGERVILAAPASLRSRLTKSMAVAERAAVIADEFAIWSNPPQRYVIFFAGSDEWSSWYGGVDSGWAGGITHLVGASVGEVVVSYLIPQSYTGFALAHELTHVSSLLGHPGGGYRESWWLKEGIADYAAMRGIDATDYDGFEATKSYMPAWDGDPAVEPPTFLVSAETAKAAYGIGFLSVRAIATTYGQDKLLDFFGRVVHQNATLEAAATAAFGVPWSAVKRQCEDFVRSAVR
jgi:hypothetical protein